jgi:hypothetical protein
MFRMERQIKCQNAVMRVTDNPVDGIYAGRVMDAAIAQPHQQFSVSHSIIIPLLSSRS